MVGMGDLLWTPSEALKKDCELSHFMDWLRRERGLDFACYDSLWRWSATEIEAFWQAVWDYFEISSPTPYDCVLDRRQMPGATWFPGAQVNYIEYLLAPGAEDAVALAARINDEAYRVFAVLSDGECNEGSVWEAAMFAAAQRLGNLCVVVDYNKWQATARSNETLALAPLRDKWAAFGWDAHEVDGHDVADLARRLAAIPARGEGRPVALIAHTVKGKGVSFMEDDNNWHYRAPTEEEVRKAHQELGLA